MNPAYGHAMEAEDAGSTGDGDGAQEAAKNGNLKHVAIHIQKDGGFSVHAHYQHAKAGHHTVESKHASAADAAEEAKRHLRGHELKRASGTGREAACEDDES